LIRSQWDGSNELQIDLEGHGREALTEHLDLSQTIGWFTSIYPLRLSSADDTLATIIEQTTSRYRSIPNHGIGYGILKYLAKDPALPSLPVSSILFNYLGQFDQATKSMEHLSVAAEDVGTSMSLNRKQTHEFVINTLITSGTLKFDIGFNVNQHSENKIQQLLVHIKQALLDLISYSKNECENENIDTTKQPNALGDNTVSPYENLFNNLVVQDDLTACVMKLNQGNETRKIFCLHPLGGTVSSYVELAKEVEEYAAFYGIQAPTLTSSLRFSSIESLSQHYVQAI
jgi:non-ribosomal peptide synthase protein (TIGR01720 family)